MKKLFKSVALLLMAVGITFGQQRVVQSEKPVPEGTMLVHTSGETRYFCFGDQAARSYTLSPSAISNANPAVITVTGHGFDADSSPTITLAGGTGSWTAVNGTFTATYVGANTFSIPVNSTAFGAVAGTITIAATASRTNEKVWLIKRTISVSDALKSVMWAFGGLVKCDDYATLSYQ